jgi:hypothetical protein
MSEVITLAPKLKRGNWCRCTNSVWGWGNTWQAWTLGDVDDALQNPEYFAAAWGFVKLNDKIELFQIYAEHQDRPETDPISMASVVIRSLTTDRHGNHVVFERTDQGKSLLFTGAAGDGIHVVGLALLGFLGRQAAGEIPYKDRGS